MFKECTIPKVTSSSGASSVSILAFVCVFCFVIEGPRIVLRVLKSMKEWKRNKRSHITGSLQAEEGVHKSMKRRKRQVKQLSVKPPTLEGFLSQN